MAPNIRSYDAKSANNFHGKISNRKHLQAVGALAQTFGAEIGKAYATGLAGDFHDFGKYSIRFQGVLQGTHQGIDHALPGAAELYKRLGMDTTLGKLCADAVSVVEAVA